MTDAPHQPAHDPARDSTDDAHLLALMERNDVSCPWCGYSLRGLDVLVCPECGHRVTLRDVLRPVSRAALYVEAFSHVGIVIVFLSGLGVGAVIVAGSQGRRGIILAGVAWFMFMLFLVALVVPSLRRTRMAGDHIETRHWVAAIAIWFALVAAGMTMVTRGFGWFW